MGFKQGDRVLIPATVVNVYHPDREPAYQSFGVSFTDGQHLMTNLINLVALPDETETESETESDLPETPVIETETETEAEPTADAKRTRPNRNKAVTPDNGVSTAEVIEPTAETEVTPS